ERAGVDQAPFGRTWRDLGGDDVEDVEAPRRAVDDLEAAVTPDRDVVPNDRVDVDAHQLHRRSMLASAPVRRPSHAALPVCGRIPGRPSTPAWGPLDGKTRRARQPPGPLLNHKGIGTPNRIRTGDLHLERVASWASRRWGRTPECTATSACGPSAR